MGGSVVVNIASGSATGDATVTLPDAYSYRPLPFLQILNPADGNGIATIYPWNIQAGSFNIGILMSAVQGDARAFTVFWLVFGQGGA